MVKDRRPSMKLVEDEMGDEHSKEGLRAGRWWWMEKEGELDVRREEGGCLGSAC